MQAGTRLKCCDNWLHSFATENLQILASLHATNYTPM
uniref:Uncharacterized protein n=1 Tax=Rhizophora mucronata TaxID=61149 RepID=A0A2P2NXR4_RHIMU